MASWRELVLSASCVMKASNVCLFGLVGVLLVGIVVQQGRINKLQGLLAILEEESERGVLGSSALDGDRRVMESKTGRVRVAREEGKAGDRVGAPQVDGEEESIGSSLRKMVENPAGKAMMNQGVKAMSMMWYANLAKKFNLSREEEGYFMTLVAGGMSAQQQVGMKMMGAETPEERQALLAEIETAKVETKEAVKQFLNDEEDFTTYEAYEARLPERQQLDGLRAAMTEAGAALSSEQEEEVLDAMYKARISQADGIDWNGGGGMEAIVSGDAVARFEADWQRGSSRVLTEVGKVLADEQLEAFKGYRDQMKEMQLMGIKMAEKMFSIQGKTDGK